MLTTQLHNRTGILCLCVIINKDTICAVLDAFLTTFVYKRVCDGSFDCCYNQENRPDNLRWLNNSRGRRCRSEVRQELYSPFQLSQLRGDTAVENMPV